MHKNQLDDGEKVGIKRVERLMKKACIKAKTAKKFVIAKNSKHSHQVASNLLERNFRTYKKDVVWVTDTTFIHTREGWLYLVKVMNLYSRKIIGWSMDKYNNRTLVCNALMMGIWRRKHPKGVIVHSYPGSTYALNDYQSLLKEKQLICSMSCRGNCWDNALAESFYAPLKNEWVNWEDSTQVFSEHESITVEENVFDQFMAACEQANAPNKALLDAVALTKENGFN